VSTPPFSRLGWRDVRYSLRHCPTVLSFFQLLGEAIQKVRIIGRFGRQGCVFDKPRLIRRNSPVARLVNGCRHRLPLSPHIPWRLELDEVTRSDVHLLLRALAAIRAPSPVIG
jgi:hypothetical protein